MIVQEQKSWVYECRFPFINRYIDNWISKYEDEDVWAQAWYRIARSIRDNMGKL